MCISMSSGCYNRFRETQKCPGPLRSRAGADYNQGNETDRRDQTTEGTRILEAKVRFSRFLGHPVTHCHGPTEWRLPGRRNEHTEPKSWQPSQRPSNSWSRWQWNLHPLRECWKKSKYQTRAGVPSLWEMANPWVWISISVHFSVHVLSRWSK